MQFENLQQLERYADLVEELFQAADDERHSWETLSEQVSNSWLWDGMTVEEVFETRLENASAAYDRYHQVLGWIEDLMK